MRFLTIFFSLFAANQVQAAPAARAVMENIPTISSVNASGFFGPLVGNVTGNLTGTATSAGTAGSVPVSGIDLSTVTTALALKADKGNTAHINLSTVTTAIALKADKGNTSHVDLSTVTTALALKADKGNTAHIDLSTVTTAIGLKLNSSAYSSSATVILNQAGYVPAGLIPTLNQNTSGLAGTASALAANGANCSAGQHPLGVDASGAAESCTADLAETNTYTSSKTIQGGLRVEAPNAAGRTNVLWLYRGSYGSTYADQYYDNGTHYGTHFGGNTLGNPLFTLNVGNNKVGISTGNPAYQLDVEGEAGFGTAASKSIFYNGGDLAIATGKRVDAQGPTGYIVSKSSIIASGFFGDGSGITGVTTTDASKVAKTGDTMTGRLTAPDATLTYGLTAATGSFSGSVTASSVTVQNGFQVGASTLVVTNSRVGIGTASPGAALQVIGTGRFGTTASDYGVVEYLDAGGEVGTSARYGSTGGANAYLMGGEAAAGKSAGLVYFDGGYGYRWGARVKNTASGFGNLTLMETGGSVGIGTASPAQALHVVGSEIITSSLTVGGTLFVPLGGAAAGGIGVIGTGDKTILIQGGTSGAVETAMRAVLLRGQFGTTTNHQASMIQNGVEFVTIPAGGGGVGILTITPATTLDVNGNAQFGSGATKSTFTATGFWEPYSRTKAQIDLLVPTKVGQVIYASDTTLPGLCISTGTLASQWRKMESATLGCGTNN